MVSNLTPQQQAAAYAPGSLVVTAGAGTGKTHMLAERYLYYLQKRNLSPLSIVAVTFTEKAANELRSRIRTLVSQQLPTRLDLLAELEAAPICTIHALASRICQEHYQIVDLPAEFTVIDDLEGKIWLEDNLTAALAQLPQQLSEIVPYSLLVKVIKQLLTAPYTADLALKQGIQDWSKLIIQARTIALVQLVNAPIWHDTYSILEQYQGETKDKLEVIRQQVLAAMADLEAEVNITEAIAVLNKIKLNVGSKKNWQGDSLATVKAALKSLRDGLVRKIYQQGLINLTLTAADTQLKTQLPAVNEAYREITAYLNQRQQQAKVLTFSDLEIYGLQALKHPKVRDYYQQRWQVYLVDEFQDTNPTQGELLTSLTCKQELTIVGDIKQLMTVFAAKGLEWSVVVVADLSRERPKNSAPVYFDAQWGVALKCQDSIITNQPVLYRWLESQHQQQEEAEALRILYVALTRARDYLVLTATEANKGYLAKLQPSLAAAKIPINTISFVPTAALPPIPPLPQPPSNLLPLLLNAIGCDFRELPVTALTEYARCPQRFKLHFLEGHPGIGEGLATGMQVGTLVHQALEYNITNYQDLLPFTDAGWQATVITEAIALAQRFLQLPLYQPYRQTAIAKEQRISYQIGKITFNGVIDLVGKDWVLDYKSDRTRQPLEHRFQLWIYAKALHQPEAYIAYLRHNYLHTFTTTDLQAIAPEVETLVAAIEAGDYTATPTLEKCAFCPYLAFCDFAII